MILANNVLSLLSQSSRPCYLALLFTSGTAADFWSRLQEGENVVHEGEREVHKAEETAKHKT